MSSNYGSNTVSVIDTSTNTVSDTITVGSGPEGISISLDGTRAYVTNGTDGTVSVIDTSTNTVIAVIVVGTSPSEVAFYYQPPVSAMAYVTNTSSNNISVINTVNEFCQCRRPCRHRTHRHSGHAQMAPLHTSPTTARRQCVGDRHGQQHRYRYYHRRHHPLRRGDHAGRHQGVCRQWE